MTDSQKGGATRPVGFDDGIAEFLRSEYETIAAAHFQTVAAISSFAKHYLAVVGVPIPVAALALKFLGDEGGWAKPGAVSALLPAAALVVGAVGVCLMCYVSCLRFDAILYARTVNRIRGFFFERSDMPYRDELRFRQLPVSRRVPRYFEAGYFLWIVLAFSSVNACYFAVAVYLFCLRGAASVQGVAWLPLVTFLMCVLGGCAIYWMLARGRERGFFGRPVIGVDIDGVLNRHRAHFCEMLALTTGKEISPEAIRRIPVHRCEELGVTPADEWAVFNHPDYWIRMPARDGAAEGVHKLKKVSSYRVFAFSHRPWPMPDRFPRKVPPNASGIAQGRMPLAGLVRAVLEYAWDHPGQFLLRGASLVVKVGQAYGRVRRSDGLAIQAGYAGLWSRVNIVWDLMPSQTMAWLTRRWLERHGIHVDRLVIERGDGEVRKGRGALRDRFVICARRGVRFFVEDDPAKARELAGICETVFLMDHPYNAGEQFPRNVVRVETWGQIYELIGVAT